MYEKTQQGPMQGISERLTHTVVLLKQYDTATKRQNRVYGTLGFLRLKKLEVLCKSRWLNYAMAKQTSLGL
jgi:hypothetical protein